MKSLTNAYRSGRMNINAEGFDIFSASDFDEITKHSPGGTETFTATVKMEEGLEWDWDFVWEEDEDEEEEEVIEDGLRVVYLKEMPFDRALGRNGRLCHSTGRAVFIRDRWWNEFEDQDGELVYG